MTDKPEKQMQPLHLIPPQTLAAIRYVLTDIDDTLTQDGKLPARAYQALWRLTDAGYQVIPVTGRPAGWCDMIARFWPVAGVVGENGALYFRYDGAKKVMIRRYWKTAEERFRDRQRLGAIQEKILQSVPGCAVAADQGFREADLAIDFCEDVPPLALETIEAIVACFTEAGAVAKISSIHVNGWFGEYDKLSMSRIFFSDTFHLDISTNREKVLYAGDSPNDSPMFSYFPVSVGVANIHDFQGQLPAEPAWVTEKRGGDGFAEIVERLLAVEPHLS